MIREELGRLFSWEERHRRLAARIFIALALTVVVDLIGALAVWVTERHAKGTDVRTFGDALFFATVQVLTVSSSLKNPLTTIGRAIDVILELWALFVLTAVAGSFASFFHQGDQQ